MAISFFNSKPKESQTSISKRKRKDKWSIFVYAFVGMAITAVLSIQPVVNAVTDIYKKTSMLSVSKVVDAGQNEQAQFEDNYADRISKMPTYADLASLNQKVNVDPNSIMTPSGGVPEVTAPVETVAGATPAPTPTTTDPVVKTTPTPQTENSTADTLRGLSTSSHEAFKNVTLGLPLTKGTYTIVSTFGDTMVLNGLNLINNGADFVSTTEQAKVYASLGGVVTEIIDTGDEKGLHAVVKSTAGNLSILYGQLSFTNIAVGDYVKTGDVIGVAAKATGANKSKFHFEIFDTDTLVRFDPEKFKYPQ